MLLSVVDIAKQAGQAIMVVYEQHAPIAVTWKPGDNSPVTEADFAANDVILSGLRALTPDIPILSEEAVVDYETRRHWTSFWLVDPLDGTRDFLKRRPEFTVNIALIENGLPVLGVLYAPATRECFWAKQGEGAMMDGQPIFNHSQRTDLVAAVSHSHLNKATESFLAQHAIHQMRRLGSALKFARLATGEVDLYPRFSPCMEWDTAAGHIILKEAGCRIVDAENNEELRYNKADLHSPHFIAVREGLEF